ncbi:MAG: hypothetical protein ACFBSC_02220 [Microcoleaceae cyanobacterium]
MEHNKFDRQINRRIYRRKRAPKTWPQMIRLLQRFGWLKSQDTKPLSAYPTDAPQLSDSGKLRKRESPSGFSSLWRKWIADGVAFTLLFGGTVLISTAGWFSYRLILNPDVGIWLNQFLPSWAYIPLQRHEAIQTLEEIRASLEEQGLGLGSPLPLTLTGVEPTESSGIKSVGFLRPFLQSEDALIQQSADVLVPVTREYHTTVAHPCEKDCKEIVELRIYKAIDLPYHRPGSPQHFRLAHKLETKGPAESYVIAPFISNRISQQRSNKPLPLSKITQFAGNVPQEGLWFNLSGERIMGQKVVPYGQVIHYNPNYYHLSMMLNWKSSAGQQPIWQQVTDDPELELLVEETIGLEPHFEIYQVQPRQFQPNRIELSSISLKEEVVDHYAYRKALRLARSGLWSPALEMMQPVKENVGKNRRYPSKWPEVAESQLDLIQFHAKITQAQATAAWASPSQKVLAGLIDGRWTEAIEMVETQQVDSGQVNTLLQEDSGRLRTRIKAALAENPEIPELQAWGALLVAAQAGRDEARSWLNQESVASPETKNWILELLD